MTAPSPAAEGEPGWGPPPHGAVHASARLARLCIAVAARRAGGTAGDLVAVAGHAAGAAAHRFSGDPAVARSDAARGDAGAYALVADPAAHGIGGPDHHRAGASGIEPADA